MSEKATAKLVKFREYIDWYSGLSVEEADGILEKLAALTKNRRVGGRVDPFYECAYHMFTVTGGYSNYPPSNTKEAKWPGCREKVVQRLRKFQMFAEEFEQPVRVAEWVPGEYAFLYFGNPTSGIIVLSPETYLEYVPDKDYSNMTAQEVRQFLGTAGQAKEQSLLPAGAEASLTKTGVTDVLNAQIEAIEMLQKEMDDVKGAKTGELARIQAEIERLKQDLDERKATLMASLKEKMAEMEQMKENLENQIFLLDSQIYAICCYAGEVVKFARIRSGKNASSEDPIVIHQKLRFLDEELGLLASLYNIQWNDVGMFEDFLKHSPLALDTFAPNKRCVVLVRLSRSAKQFGRNADNPYSNMLEDYEYYHGKTVGIIIRNGENVYLGWTDEDRVHIEDDLISTPVVTNVEPAKAPEFHFESERKQYEKEQKAMRKKLMDGIVSRSFVYNILQGVVDNTPMLPLPEGVRLNKQSKYVVYSIADKWLTDDRYGNFTDLIKQCNENATKGDMVLTVQHLVPERDRSWDNRYWSNDRPWDNSRGRGEANRTHDASVDDCTIYPINLVEFDRPVEMARYKWKGVTGEWHEFTDQLSEVKEDEDHVIIETYTYRKRHVFVSVQKTESRNWEGYKGDVRANFELYENEYINLTYMNSTWLEWVITNKKLGGWTIGGKKVDYAYAIRYLKTAMDHIRKREEEEKALIDAVDPGVCVDSQWPLKLTQWKLANHVRNITPYQAKRFVRDINAGEMTSNGEATM